jgi:ectoine hydroxylase-related dioxygenase (phytanoyl-CoA dioxygenase family)
MDSGTRPERWQTSLARDGFLTINRFLSREQVTALTETTRVFSSAHEAGVLRRDGDVYGVRDLLARVPEVRRLAESARLLSLVESILGPGAFVVRGLFFNKTPTANWNLPWHQDVTIAVKQKLEVAGFGPWTLKTGIPHVHAPGELLARMITVRLHLDDCGQENGPMRVLPGSHATGRLNPAEVASWTAEASRRAISCVVPAGGAFIMSPLLLHASAVATAPGHRRVIHLEYAAEELPGGLEWFQGPTFPFHLSMHGLAYRD